MKVLITGGLGFIGGRLAKHLVEIGHEVVLGTRQTLIPPIWLPNAKMALIDWGSDRSITNACLDVELVIHSAGMNSKDCELNPVEAHNFNGKATSKILTAAIANGVKTFIYISTAHVYSNPLQGYIDETTIPNNSHPYATSHLEGEKYVTAASEQELINSVVIRLSNAYGTPTNPEVKCWSLFVNDLCNQAITTRLLRFSASPVTQRNFITLSDVCRIISTLVNKSQTQALPPIINVGNTYSSTITQMAQLIEERCKNVLSFKPNIVFNALLKNNTNLPLDFKSLHADLFRDSLLDEKEAEIDNLILFCEEFSAVIQSTTENK